MLHTCGVRAEAAADERSGPVVDRREEVEAVARDQDDGVAAELAALRTKREGGRRLLPGCGKRRRVGGLWHTCGEIEARKWS